MPWLALSLALAADLTVGPTGTYATLEDAVDDALTGDRLLVEPGTYVERQLDVGTRTITIEATAPGVILQSTNNRRAFDVSGGDLTLIGLEVDLENDIGLLELRTGRFEAIDCFVHSAQAPIPGQPAANIDAEDGTVVLTNSVFDGAVSGNKEGGHIYGVRTDVVIDGSTLRGGDADGGVAWLDGGSLVATDSTFEDHTGGPAVRMADGPVTFTLVTLRGATSGALDVTNSDVTLADGLFEANNGAVDVSGGTLLSTGTRFEANNGADVVALRTDGTTATLDGVAFVANVATAGDVARCDGGSCTFLAPRFEDNDATGAVLALRGATGDITEATACLHGATTTLVAVDAAGSLTMTGSALLANQLTGPALTVAADSAATLVNNSLVLQEAGSTLVLADGPLAFTNNLVSDTTTTGDAVQAVSLTGGYNLYFGNSGGDVPPPLATDILGIDPLIGTPVVGSCDVTALAPQAGSPLVDAGDPALLDPDGSRSDIGAFGGEPPADTSIMKRTSCMGRTAARTTCPRSCLGARRG